MTNLAKLKKKKEEFGRFWKKKNKLYKNFGEITKKILRIWKNFRHSFTKDFWKIKSHIKLRTIFQPFTISDPLLEFKSPNSAT